MKSHFQKQKQQIINYRDNRKFSESEYRQQILYVLPLLINVWGKVSFKCFLDMCKETLDKTAPVEQKKFRSIHCPF